MDLVYLQETKIEEMSSACACSFGVVDFLTERLRRQREQRRVFFCFGIKGNWTSWRSKQAFSLFLAGLKTWRMGFSGPSQVSMAQSRGVKGNERNRVGRMSNPMRRFAEILNELGLRDIPLQGAPSLGRKAITTIVCPASIDS